VRGFVDFFTLLKKNVGNVFLTALRKQKIRQAYRGGFYIHPFFILLFIATAVLIALLWFVPPQISSLIRSAGNNKILVDTNFKVIETFDEATAIGEGFLEPFAVVDGMEAMRYMIVVDKFHRILYLLRQGTTRWGVFRVYPVAIGENEGAKLREGDRRTPQGLYFMVRKRYQAEMVRSYGRTVAAQFGPHAFVLNYPNRHDTAARRTGSGIWIHGTFDNTIPIVSRGCVSMHNTYAEELYSFIGDGLLTPVILIEERHSDLKNLINLSEIWQERLLVAEEFGIDPFTNLHVGRQDVPQLPFPGVEIQPITLTPQASIAPTTPPAQDILPSDERQRRQPPIVDMEAQRNQRTPPVRPTRTTPTQDLAQNQITQLAAQQNAQTQAQATQTQQVAQSTPPQPAAAQQNQNAAPTPAPRQNVQTPPTPAALAPQPTSQPPRPSLPAAAQRSEQGIAQFTLDWARAWESRNLEAYSRFYDAQNFPDWRAFRANKQNIFGSVDTISVILDDINVVSMSENGASVRFNQLYQTERSRFYSRKQLDLVWSDGAWRIVNEFVVR